MITMSIREPEPRYLQPGRMGGTGYQQNLCFCRTEFNIGGSSRDVRATMAVVPGDATRAVLDAR
jgi:hypothetical protein